MKEFQILNDPKKIYKSMLEDISNAKESIFLETYMFDDDSIGKIFLDTLIKKAKQGITIKILIDAWGSSAKKSFFKDLISYGGEVRFFREIQYVLRTFFKNHERNHRKLLIIDDKIFYIGSANITQTCLNWRELVLRLKGESAIYFTKSFMKSWEDHDKFSTKKIRSFITKEFEIINDIPSKITRITEKKYIELINQAQYKILIETPYFVPSKNLLNAFYNAIKRGVQITIILPYHSDVKILDVVRNPYLGVLSEKGIQIYLYKPKILHSKLLIVDSDFFLLGSSNLDYRSFMYQYEINFIGVNKLIIKNLIKYFNETLKNSVEFIYDDWKKRSYIKRLFEYIVSYIEKLL